MLWIGRNKERECSIMRAEEPDQNLWPFLARLDRNKSDD